MIAEIFESGALPALERLAQFTEQRHKVLVNNIANFDTPFFKPRDLDPKSFQDALGKAIDRRRATITPMRGRLDISDTRQLTFYSDRMAVDAAPTNQNILFHDQNNRDLERTMQHLAENTLAHNVAIELLRSEYALIETAIRERV